ncbi:MAG: hypothetical protein ACR2OU_21665 [Thermomicrobiales bacterium]
MSISPGNPVISSAVEKSLLDVVFIGDRYDIAMATTKVESARFKRSRVAPMDQL